MSLFDKLLSLLRSEIESIVQDQKQQIYWDSGNPNKTVLFEFLSQDMIDKIKREKDHKQKVLVEWVQVLDLFYQIEQKLETISNPNFDLPDQELPDQVIPDCDCEDDQDDDYYDEYPTPHDFESI